MMPLHHEFGWSTGVMSAAVSVNLLLRRRSPPRSWIGSASGR